jgi:hypothetical protein
MREATARAKSTLAAADDGPPTWSASWKVSLAASKMGGYLRPKLELHREFLEELGWQLGRA